MLSYRRSVAPLLVLLLILRHTNHSRNNNGVQISHGFGKSTIWKLIVPTILDLSDLATLVKDLDLALNLLLHPNTLDGIFGLHVHLNWVAGAGHGVV